MIIKTKLKNKICSCTTRVLFVSISSAYLHARLFLPKAQLNCSGPVAVIKNNWIN